ncbi:MAG: protein kinase, partial [Myxococcota bacterium]
MKAYCHHCLSRIDHVSALRCPVCQRGSLPGGGWPRDRWLDCTVDSGKYRVESLLGMGGFGTVYAVRHTLVEDRVLAMKMLNALSNGDPVLEQMFLDEIRILMRLDHPNIVQCHEVGRLEDGSLFVLMEKIEGKQLDDIVVS